MRRKSFFHELAEVGDWKVGGVEVRSVWAAKQLDISIKVQVEK